MTSFSNNNSDEISKIEKANRLANTSNFSGGDRSYRSRTLHLHIGIPKTASTWLQTKVFTQLQPLCYLDCSQNKMFENKADLTKDRQTLGSIFKQSSQVWDGYGDAIFKDLLGDRQEWLADGRDLLISDESIGRQGSRPALLSAHFRKMKLKAVDWGFERINIICLIRRQDHWLASHYAQMSDRNPKAGQADFERLVEEVCSPYLSRYSFGMLLDYCILYDHLVESDGTDGVFFLPYEMLKNSPAEFLQVLLTKLATPSEIIESICNETSGTMANVRSEQGVWHLRRRRSPFYSLPLLRGFSNTQKQTIELKPDITRKILNTYSAGNHELANKTNLDLNRLGYFLCEPDFQSLKRLEP